MSEFQGLCMKIPSETVHRMTDRQEVEINFKRCEGASNPFSGFFQERNCRLVIMREKTKDPPLDLFEKQTGEGRTVPGCLLTPFFCLFFSLKTEETTKLLDCGF
jgi:hypothetical protein